MITMPIFFDVVILDDVLPRLWFLSTQSCMFHWADKAGSY